MDSTITPTWRLRAYNPSFAPVDLSQISDVVMHLRYTARDGGEAHRQSTISGLPDALSTLGSLAVTAWPDTVSLDFANSGGAYDWTTASEVTIILQFTVETAP